MNERDISTIEREDTATIARLQEELEVLSSEKATSELPSVSERDSESSSSSMPAEHVGGSHSSKEKHVTFREPVDSARGQDVAPVVAGGHNSCGNAEASGGDTEVNEWSA